MAIEFTYTPEDYEKTAVNDFPVQSGAAHKIEKGLKRLLVIAAVVLAAEFVWLFAISPCIPFSTVEVKGFSGFDGAAVLQAAGIGEGASFISVNAEEAQRLLSGHFLVESAKVLKRFPDRLSIFLEPRRAAALSLAKIQGRLLPVYYDRHGVIFRIGGGEAVQAGLPLVSGLVIEEPVLGMRLPAMFIPFLTELAKIAAESPELLGAVSEIQIVRKPYNGFDLVLYPAHNPVRVRLGNNINEETLRYVMLMLDVAGAQAFVPGEIDFRSGIGAYTVKEAYSGK